MPFISHLVCLCHLYMCVVLCFQAQTTMWCGVISGYGHNDANDNNRRVHLAFPTHKWNVVNLNVTSFLAPKLNISGTHHKADFTPNLTLWWNPGGGGPMSDGKVITGRWPLQLDHRGSPLKTTGKWCVFVTVSDLEWMQPMLPLDMCKINAPRLQGTETTKEVTRLFVLLFYN